MELIKSGRRFVRGVNARSRESVMLPAQIRHRMSEPFLNTSNSREIMFYHGLGDACHFACMLPLYARRGFDIRIVSALDKLILFRAAGVEATNFSGRGAYRHPWEHGIWNSDLDVDTWIVANKALHNISKRPMPFIGSAHELLNEYLAVTLNFDQLLIFAKAKKIGCR